MFRRHALKPLLCVLLFVVIALGLAACGGYSSPSSPGGGPTPTNSGY